MKLLVVTQKVDRDDPILGFFHSWLAEFAKRVERVSVICLEEGKHSLPENVRVYSLGKEKGYSKFGYAARFYHLIFKFRSDYDTVFVHMNPEYVVLAGDLWHLMGKKVSLWYVHRAVNLKLRLAANIADIIFTSSPESFGIKSSKVVYLGHGIDPDKFPRVPFSSAGLISLVHLGRISRIKNIGTIFHTAALLRERGQAVRSIDLAGDVITEDDRIYKKELEVLASKLGVGELIRWNYAKRNEDVFTQESISINAAPNGGMDKAVLGSLAAERPTFASNSAFRDIFGQYALLFMYEAGNEKSLAEKISEFLKLPDRRQIVAELSLLVRKEYTTAAIVEKITKKLQ